MRGCGCGGDEGDVADAIDADGGRQVADDRVVAAELCELVGEQLVERFDGVAVLRQAEAVPVVGPEPDAQPQEVGVGASTLPPPGGVPHDVGQRGGFRVGEQRFAAHLGVHGPQPFAFVFQVVQESFALVAAAPRRLSALREGHADAADDGDDEDERGDEHHERVCAQHGDHEDGGHRADDG